MKRREFLASAATFPIVLSTQAESDYQSIFDGQTLNGWVVEEGPESAFYVSDGAIVATETSMFPAWLRSEKRYENFDFQCEFFVKGWIDGGIYFSAPLHGRASWVGMQVKIFHQRDEVPKSNSMGSIFPLVAPSRVNVKSEGSWNTLRILLDWPQLKISVNEELVQDLDLEKHPELRHRLRSGFLGLSALGYPLRFRNLKIRELRKKENWENLYVKQDDINKWFVSESEQHAPAQFEAIGNILRATGGGHLSTHKKYRDFELNLYVRGPKEHNGGILLRSGGKGFAGQRHYEIQIHNVEEAHYPTGSLYHFKRSIYPRIEDDKWYPMQIRMKGPHCLVRVNGDTVLEYDQLEILDEGNIEIQAHRPGSWLEFKEIRVKQI